MATESGGRRGEKGPKTIFQELAAAPGHPYYFQGRLREALAWLDASEETRCQSKSLQKMYSFKENGFENRVKIKLL